MFIYSHDFHSDFMFRKLNMFEFNSKFKPSFCHTTLLNLVKTPMQSQHIQAKLICDFLSSWCWFTRSLLLVPTNYKSFFALVTKNLTGATAQIKQWYRWISFRLLWEALKKFFLSFSLVFQCRWIVSSLRWRRGWRQFGVIGAENFSSVANPQIGSLHA